MAGLQLSGLASGFDWKTFVDQLIDLERTPINRLQTEKTTNERRATALDGLNTRMTDLQLAVKALNTDGLFTARSAATTTAGSLWSATASAGTATGSYAFDVTQLATTARRTGANDIGSGLSATNDVSGLTLASLPTASAVTAGTFTVNGGQVTVALTDSLQDVFTKIATATGNDVSAAYDATTDRITLTSASNTEIVMGAGNDSSNFLAVARLANNGSPSVGSSSALGATRLNTPLASARLRGALGADGTGAGTFAINGVAIAYNVNTDSLSGLLARISNAGAGVSASYDGASDRVILTNQNTGDTGLNVSDTTGSLMSALGLTGSSTLTRGKNTLFSVNGGGTLSSSSNTLNESVHGITGLSVLAKSQGAETIAVSANTGAMRTAIDNFVLKFNVVQSYIDDQSKITTTKGKVTAGILSNNREVQAWGQTLRSSAFAGVSGLSGAIARIENLGIDFNGTSSQLVVKDSAKLETALRDKSTDVEAFFRTASTGLNAKLNTLLTKTLGSTGSNGAIDSQAKLIAANNTSIDRQIADLERRLEQRRSQLESSFIAMETAQSKIKTMQTQITNAFGNKNTSTS